MASFEVVADEYDAARPSYPAEVFDALEPLAGESMNPIGLFALAVDGQAGGPTPAATDSNGSTTIGLPSSIHAPVLTAVNETRTGVPLSEPVAASTSTLGSPSLGSANSRSTPG